MKILTDPFVYEFSKRIRSRLGEQVGQILLYGSRARGDSRPISDYDFIIVVPQRMSWLREQELDVEVEMMNDYDCLFSSLIYSDEEWKRVEQFPLGLNVQRNGIAL